jgi:hypothetical protein
MYGLMAVTAAWAALIALRFDRLPRRTATWLTAAVMLAALMSHYFNALFVGAIAIWGLLTLRDQTRRRWLLAQFVAWSIFAVWVLLMGQAFLNPTNLSVGKAWSFTLPPWETLAGLIRSGLEGYRDKLNMWLVLIGGVALVGIWLAGTLHSRGRTRSLLLSVVAVPLTVAETTASLLLLAVSFWKTPALPRLSVM